MELDKIGKTKGACSIPIGDTPQIIICKPGLTRRNRNGIEKDLYIDEVYVTSGSETAMARLKWRLSRQFRLWRTHMELQVRRKIYEEEAS